MKIHLIGALTIMLGPFVAVGLVLFAGWLMNWEGEPAPPARLPPAPQRGHLWSANVASRLDVRFRVDGPGSVTLVSSGGKIRQVALPMGCTEVRFGDRVVWIPPGGHKVVRWDGDYEFILKEEVWPAALVENYGAELLEALNAQLRPATPPLGGERSDI